jgi:hypothetical protein
VAVGEERRRQHETPSGRSPSPDQPGAEGRSLAQVPAWCGWRTRAGSPTPAARGR